MNPVLLPELRYRRLWLVAGLLMAGFIALICLLPGRDLPEIHVWDKLEHVLAFGALAFWFGSVIVRRDFLWLWLVLVAFGGLIELLQGWMALGRQADWKDLFADSIGITASLLLALTPLGRWARWLEALFIGKRA